MAPETLKKTLNKLSGRGGGRGGGGGGSSAKAPKEKNAPKRAKSSWFLFCDEQRPKLRAELPNGAPNGSKISATSKILSERWANLSDEERQKYVDMAEALKEKFNESQPAHMVKLPQGWKRQTDATSKLSFYLHMPTKTCQWTRPTASDVPSPTVVLPRNSFTLFSIYVRSQTSDKVPPKVLSAMWKNVSADLKAEFESKAVDDKERYERDRKYFLKHRTAPVPEPVAKPTAEMPPVPDDLGAKAKDAPTEAGQKQQTAQPEAPPPTRQGGNDPAPSNDAEMDDAEEAARAEEAALADGSDAEEAALAEAADGEAATGMVVDAVATATDAGEAAMEVEPTKKASAEFDTEDEEDGDGQDKCLPMPSIP
jgi:hypothetical protein